MIAASTISAFCVSWVVIQIGTPITEADVDAMSGPVIREARALKATPIEADGEPGADATADDEPGTGPETGNAAANAAAPEVGSETETHHASEAFPAPLTPRPDEAPVLARLNRLASPNPDDVLAATVAAGERGLVLYDLPLQRLLASHDAPAVRAAAAAALAELPWPADQDDLKERIAALADATDDAAVAVRIAAITALGEFPTLAARQALGACLLATDAEELFAVGAALARLRQPSNLRRLSGWFALDVVDSDEADDDLDQDWPLAQAAALLLGAPQDSANAAGVELLLRSSEPAAVRWLLHFAVRHATGRAKSLAFTAITLQPRPEDEALILAHLDHPSASARLYAARAAGSYRSQAIADRLAARLAEEAAENVREMLGASLAQQETVPLCKSLLRLIRAGSGPAQAIAIDLVRQRTGPAAFLVQVFAFAASPTAAAEQALRANDGTRRETTLLPYLSSELFPDFAAPERRAILLGLSGRQSAKVTAALLMHLTPQTSPDRLAEFEPLLAEQPDVEVVPHLRRLLASETLAAREEVYQLLLARASVDAAELIARGLDEETDPTLRAALLTAAAGHDEPVVIERVAALVETELNARSLSLALDVLAGVRDPTLGPRFASLVRRHAAQDRAVSDRALELLLALPAPAPLNGVRALALDTSLPLVTRLAALETLGELGDEADLAVLEELLAADDDELRLAARNAMHIISPEDYPLFDTWGRYPLVAAAGGFGASLFGLVGHTAGAMTGDPDEKRTLGLAIGGGVLGSATAWLFTIDQDISLGQAGYFATTGTWATLGSYGLARVTRLSQTDPSAALWAAIAGQTAGIALGGATLSMTRFTPSDVLLTNTVAASWGFGAMGVHRLVHRQPHDGPGLEDAFFLGGLIGAAPMLALSPYTELDGNDLLGVGGCVAVGSWIGAFAPFAILDEGSAPDGADVMAGIAMGQAVGLSAGLALTAVTDFEGESFLWGGIGLASGAATGAGLGLLATPSERRATFAMLEGGTLLGGGLLTWLGPQVEYGDNDAALITMLTLAGGVAGGQLPGVALSGLAAVEPDLATETVGGGLLLGSSLGFYSGLVTSQLVDLSAGELAMTGVGSTALGFGAGGLALMIPDVDPRVFSPLASAGTAVGAIGLALLAPRLDYDGDDAVFGASSAALGLGLGLTTPLYWTAPDATGAGTPMLGGAMFGTALGLFTAGAVSQLADLSWQRTLRADAGALDGLAIGLGLGLLVPDFEREATVALAQAGALAGFGVGMIFDRDDDFEVAEGLHLALGAGTGAWHGWQIPFLWRDPTVDGGRVPGEEIAGGVLLGAGLGILGTGLLHELGDYEAADVGEVALFELFGSSLGGGLALVLEQDDRRAGFALMQGAGLAALGLGEWLAPYTEYVDQDRWLVAAMVAEGAVGGFAMPYVAGAEAPRDPQLGGGALIGAATAGLAGLALTQLRPTAYADIAEMGAVSGLGAVAGLGIAGSLPGAAGHELVAGADIGWLAGMGLGLGLAPYTELTRDDLIFMTASSAVGAWSGGALARAIHGDDAGGEQMASAGAAGLTLGFLGAGAAAQGFDLDPGITLEASVLATAGAVAASGFDLIGVPGSPQEAAAWQPATALGAFGLGLGLGQVTELSENDVYLVTSSAGLGAWHGAFAPTAMGYNSGRKAVGAAMIGAGAGTVLGYGLTQLVELDPDDNLEMVGATAVGSMIGGGAGLLANLDWQGTAGALEIGSLAGLGLGAGFAQLTDYDQAAPLLSATAVWGAWNGGWLGAAIADDDLERRIPGGALLGLGSGLALGMAASQLAVPSDTVLISSSLAMAAGNAIGGGSGLLTGSERRLTTGLVAAVGTAGLIAGLATRPFAVHIGDGDGLGPVAPQLVAGSAWGAWNGGWLGAAVAGDADPTTRIVGGGLLGFGSGLGLSLAVAHFHTLEDADLVESSLFMAAGNLIGGGAGLLFEADREPTYGLVAGLGTAGLVAGLIASPYTEYNSRAIGMAAVMGGLGAVHGGLLAGILDRDDRNNDQDGIAMAGGAMFGAGLGTLGGMMLSQRLTLEPLDLFELSLTAATGAAIGVGFGTWLQLGGPQLYGSVMAGSVGFTTLGLLAAEATDFDGPDRLLTLHAALLGGWFGAWAPVLWNASDGQLDAPGFRGQDIPAGGLLGIGLGLVGGGLASQWLDLEYGDVGEVMVGSGLASTFGAGLGLVASRDQRAWVGSMIGAGLLGTTAIALASPYTEFDGGDTALGIIAGLYGVYQGLGLELLLNDEAGPHELGGAMLLGAAAGGLAGMYLGPFVDLDATDVWMLSAGSAWGTWLGVCLTVALNDPDDVEGGIDTTFKQGTGWTALFTDLGLAAMSFGISQLVDLEPLRFAWISVGGGVGALVGFLIGAMTGNRAQGMWAGMGIGTASGLVAGTVLTQFIDLPGMGEPEEPAPIDGPTADAALAPVGGLLPEIDEWYPSVQVMPAGTENDVGSAAGTQYLFTVTGTFR